MSWQALKDTFDLEEKRFNAFCSISGDVKDALCRSLEPRVDTPTFDLPEGGVEV
jgi:hypothetical protein